MFYYNHHLVYLVVMAPIYGGVVWYLTSDLASIELLSSLQAAVIPLMTFSRVSMFSSLAASSSSLASSLLSSYPLDSSSPFLPLLSSLALCFSLPLTPSSPLFLPSLFFLILPLILPLTPTLPFPHSR